MQFRNRYLMMAKNDPLSSLVRDLPRILPYEMLALGFALLRERFLLRGYARGRAAAAAHAGQAARAPAPPARARRAAPPPYGLEPAA